MTQGPSPYAKYYQSYHSAAAEASAVAAAGTSVLKHHRDTTVCYSKQYNQSIPNYYFS